jgi:hypothetical protein
VVVEKILRYDLPVRFGGENPIDLEILFLSFMWRISCFRWNVKPGVSDPILNLVLEIGSKK